MAWFCPLRNATFYASASRRSISLTKKAVQLLSEGKTAEGFDRLDGGQVSQGIGFPLSILPEVLEPVLERHRGKTFYVTEKLDGTSFTAFLRDGEFGICSRNLVPRLGVAFRCS